MYRLTYALIDNDILEENVKKIKKRYAVKYYIGVVKNNAYGHGIHIIPSLIRGGINYLAVSSLDEALEIRTYYLDIPILILEPFNIENINVAIENNITVTIENLEYVEKLNTMNLEHELKIHLKIDSGFNRLGFKDREDLEEAVNIINNNDHLYLEGIYSHFATSGFIDPYFDKQKNKIAELLQNIDLKNIPIIHFDRSITLLRHNISMKETGIRIGMLMYGFNFDFEYPNDLKGKIRKIKRDNYLKKYNISSSILKTDLDVLPALSLYSTVISLRSVKKGDIVGYDGLYKCLDDGIIATIPIGYADGVSKLYRKVFINGKRYKIVNDSMDMLMVLVDKDIKVGMKVEIIGENIPIKEVSETTKLNLYHLYSMISNRVVRVHKEFNEESEIKY